MKVGVRIFKYFVIHFVAICIFNSNSKLLYTPEPVRLLTFGLFPGGPTLFAGYVRLSINIFPYLRYARLKEFRLFILLYFFRNLLSTRSYLFPCKIHHGFALYCIVLKRGLVCFHVLKLLFEVYTPLFTS